MCGYIFDCMINIIFGVFLVFVNLYSGIMFLFCDRCFEGCCGNKYR